MSPLTLHGDDSPKWCPVPVRNLEGLLEKLIVRGSGFSNVYALRKNIAYNLQYLEFLDRCLSDVKLTEAIRTQIIKNFICVGCAIVESLLEFLLIRAGVYKRTEWSSICVFHSQASRLGERVIMLEIEMFEKLSTKRRVEMTFDAMLKKAEAKKILGSDHTIYAKLQALRKLRNRVHLHLIDQPTDTDWNAFKHSHLCAMAQVIHTIFAGALFRPRAEEKAYFEYLNGENYQH